MAIKLGKDQRKELEGLIVAFESAHDKLFDFLDALANDWEGEIEDHSDKWREGEAGLAAQEKIDAVRSWMDEFSGEGGQPGFDLDLLS